MTPFAVIFALVDSDRPVTARALFQRLAGARGDQKIIADTCAALVAHGLADRRTRANGTHEYSISPKGHDVLRDE